MSVLEEEQGADSGRFHGLLEPLLEATLVFDMTDWTYLYANDGMARLRGSTAANAGLVTKAVWTHDSQAFLMRVLPKRRASFLAGERRRYVDELAMCRVDGSVVWTETDSYLVNDPSNGHLLICSSVKPIRRQDWMDAAHDGQVRLLDEIQDLSKIGLWTYDPFTSHGRWSEEIARIHELDDIVDASVLRSQFDEASTKRIRENEAHSLATGEPYSLELQITTPAGNRKWIRLNGRAIFEHGEPVRIRGTTQDITDRKTVELALAAERAQMQSLLDHMPDIVALKDLEGRVLACNARFEKLFGFGPGELLGKTIENYAPRELATEFGRRDQTVRKLHQIVRGEDWITFADGHRELCESITGPVRGPTGEVTGTLRIARDVTAERATEEQARASQKMEAIGRLAGGVAHDFNNLLSVIVSYSHLVAEALPPDDPIQEDLNEIRAASKRAEALTRQLLAFSRRQLLQYTPLALDEIVDGVGNMVRRVIGEDVKLEIERTTDLFTTKADRGQIEQVVMNLVVNARDAMPKGGTITIATKNVHLDERHAHAVELTAGAYVELSVEDTGVGIEPTALSRVFEPFFSINDLGKGTGLGLAMVYGIVKQIGGGIAVESTLGYGSIFRIFLPRLELAEDSGPSSQKRARPRGHETILIVEDEESLRAVAKRVVAQAGYEVLLAANAEEALQIAKTDGARIDLVFTDVVMPGMHGGELVERLLPICPRMKVIFTSGYTDEKLAESGVGEHCFIAKPYEPSRVTETIRKVLDDGSPQSLRSVK